MNPVNSFLLGMITMACVTVSMFFLRFWANTRDRLFLIFALAFGILGLTRVPLALWPVLDEHEPYIYGLRSAAFLLIAFAVWDKNRTKSSPGQEKEE